MFTAFAKLTKYSKINGCAMAGSILPTITTVNVEGSLKQLSKYSQAFLGSILGRSLTCGGYTNRNNTALCTAPLYVLC